VVAIDLDRLLGGVTHDITILAPVKVFLKFQSGVGVNVAVEILIQLVKKL
jgi:hypothetical protein